MRRTCLVLGGVLLVLLLTSLPASATSFTVSPWAYACGNTVYGNPAVAHDPGEAGCAHPDGQSYCPNGDTLGEASSAYAGGKLTLTKSGEQCDDLSSGATIGGLSTLTSASVDCAGNCQPGGGSPRLNLVDSSGKFYFAPGTAEGNHITFDVSAVQGKTLKSINIIADLTGTMTLSNLSFSGQATPAPSPSPSPVGCVPGGTASPARVACPSPVPTTSPSTTTTTTTTTPLPPTTGVG